MPLHGKIVVIKRSGGDGTEFPLTASCLFGRKPDCDIRIQIPEVSKEHCKIELNENKEVILTNLSSVNPTRVNGKVFQQSERLKHGDLITIIDRSFRFEYPPAPTPKKRSSNGSKSENPQILHETQARDTSTNDGTNTSEFKPKVDEILDQKKHNSPFGDLYQMFKKDLDSKTPKKAPGTPASKFYPQKHISPNKVDGASVISTPKKEEAENVSPDAGVTPKSAKKKRKSLKGQEVEGNVPVEEVIQLIPSSQETPKGKRRSSKSKLPETVEETPTPVSQRYSNPTTPLQFNDSEVVKQILECLTTETEKTLTKRGNNESTPIKTSGSETETPTDSVFSNDDLVSAPSTPKTKPSCSTRSSPRSAGKQLQAQDALPEPEVTTPIKAKPSSGKKRKSGDLESELPAPMSKRKRVSFGGHLEPELFDKRLPPDSPLRKGATPGRRSLCVVNTKQSLLRRASVIGLMKKHELSTTQSPLLKGSPGKKTSPKTPSPAKKSPKATPKTPSPAKSPKATPKTPSPAKKSAKAMPKTPSPAKMSPKATPKTPSPAKKSPKATPKTPSPAKKSPKATPKTPSPAKKSPKATPKTPSPAKKSPKATPKTPSPAKKSPKATPKTPSPAKKSPKATPKTPSPAKKSPKATPKTPSPAKKSPKATPKTPSPAKMSPSADKEKKQKTVVKSLSSTPGQSSLIESQTPKAGKTPKTSVSLPSANKTPTVQGRFSVSRISTPSPTGDKDSFQQSFATATPCLRSRRSSIKGTPKSTVKTALQVIRRRSGVSRASMKVVNSWADIVKFGQTKTQAVIPTKKPIRMTKTRKTVVTKAKTPAKNLLGHVSTGHADSPVTIVVGKAHKLRAGQTTGAAPKVVHNIALLKRNMVMDEDLSGIAEIFKTPARQRKSVANVQSVLLTPQRGQSASTTESSVMDTPEESGEMVVSPLVVSTAKRGVYNTDAVIRLLDDQESSFTIPTEEATDDAFSTPNKSPITETASDESEEQQPEPKHVISTPKQKLEPTMCLTGVKRIMKTPKQKAEPIEDLRGKLLKTPKQKMPEQAECLTGVKRIMKTPKQKAEPIEDLRGKLLKTPKQKMPEQAECLTGVKRLMKTPKQKAAPVEDLRGKLMKTPRGPKAAEELILDGVKYLLKTPKPSVQTDEEVSANTQVDIVHSEANEVEETGSSDSISTIEAVEETAAVPSESVEEKQEPAEAVEKDEETDSAEALGELEEPIFTPAKIVEEEVSIAVPVALEPLAASVEAAEMVEPVIAHVEMVESDVAHVEAAEMVEPVVAHIQEVEMVEPVTACVEAAEMVEPVSARVEAAEMIEPAPVSLEVVKVEPIKSEDPTALSVPVKGRRGKKTEATVPLPARTSARGRGARCIKTRCVDEPVESLDVQEEKAVECVPVEKPKRGRKVKQASVEHIETVEKEEVESLKILQIEDQQPSSVVPVQKSRRGRNAKPFLERSVERVINIMDNTAEAVAVEIPPTVEVVAPVSVAKPKRGKKVKQESVEHIQSLSVETPVEQVEAQEQTTMTAVEKPKTGGRKTKQASQEHVETMLENTAEAVAVEIPPTVEVDAPVPVAKPKRGRKTKQASQEQVEAVLENTAETESVHVIEKIEAQAVVVKCKRGKNTKLGSVETELSPIEIIDAIELPAVCIEKPRARGRRAKQGSAEDITSVEQNVAEAVAVEISPTLNVDAPVSVAKPKRGRKTKQESVENIQSLSVETPVEQVEAQDQTTVTAVEKPKRGGRKTKQDPECNVPPVSKEAPEETSAPLPEKPKKGRKAKQETVSEMVEVENMVVQEVHVPEETAEVDVKLQSEETSPETEDHFEAPVKPGRARKAQAVVTEVPVKRARRGAAYSAKENTVSEETVEVPTQPLKRGRRPKSTVSAHDSTIAAVRNPLEVELTNIEAISVVNKKGKSQKKLMNVSENISEQLSSVAKVANNTSKSVNWKPDLDVTHDITPLPKPRKSRLKDNVSINVEVQPEPVEEQQVVKTVRGRRTRADVEVEPVKSTPSKRVRHSAVETTEASAKAVVPISKPINKRSQARSSKTPEEVDLSDKAVPNEPVKTTRWGAKSTVKAPATTDTQKGLETVSKATVVAATKGRGKALTKRKVVPQEIDIEQSAALEQSSKPRRGRAAKQ